MIHLASKAVICHHLDIWYLTEDGKLRNIMTHIDISTVEYIKVSLWQVAGSPKMSTTGPQIIMRHHQVACSMTDNHLMEMLQGMFHQILGTWTLIFLMDSHKEQDLQHHMSPGQSYRRHSWLTETNQDLMIRMGTMHITMTEDRPATGVTKIRGQVGLNHKEWMRMRLTLTRFVFSDACIRYLSVSDFLCLTLALNTVAF